MKRRIGNIAWVLFGILWSVVALLSAVLEIGTDAGLYCKLQMKAGILEESGIASEEELYALDMSLADYLDGKGALADDQGACVYALDVNGVRQLAFNEREMQHLKDCQRLFALGRSVQIAAAFLLALLYLLANRLANGRRDTIRRINIGLAIPLALLAAFGVWAAADFSAAFTFFHKVLFTNDLWLLDPATDLLIRICPSSMFAEMGLRIAVYSLLGMLLLPVLELIDLLLKRRKRKRKNGWKR